MALRDDTIYYGVDGERHGPVDLQTLRTMVARGELLPEDFVWDEDAEDWIEIGRYPQLDPETSDETTPDSQWRGGLSPGLEPLPPDHPSVRRAPAPLPCAGFGARLIAYIIDIVLLMPVTFVWQIEMEDRMGMQLSEVMFGSTSTDPSVLWAELKFMLLVQLGIKLILWIYYASFESSRWQATPGKKLMRLVATDERGHRLSFGQASIRYWGKILSELTFLFGYVMIAFTDRHQGLHDKIARTLVLHR